MTPYLFVHVPKTAGTSLKAALVKEFGNRPILFDYGKNSELTSEVIRRSVYFGEDFYKIARAAPSLICGHFYVKKYMNLSVYEKVLTFVRDPLERVLSEYKHFRRHHGYQESIEVFASMRRNINVMSNYFIGHPWPAFGFIGVSEKYDESVEYLGNFLGKSIDVEKLNFAPDSQEELCSAADKQLILSLNKKDCSLYQKILENFNELQRVRTSNLPTVSGGWKIDVRQNLIKGFAYYHDSTSPVHIVVLIGNDKFEVVANELDTIMHRHSRIRSGYVGFELKVPTDKRESVSCLVRETNQKLQQFED